MLWSRGESRGKVLEAVPPRKQGQEAKSRARVHPRTTAHPSGHRAHSPPQPRPWAPSAKERCAGELQPRSGVPRPSQNIPGPTQGQGQTDVYSRL